MSQDNRLEAAGFYGRVSGEEDESIESQLMVARETAAKEGFYIPDGPDYIFRDVHISGTTMSRNGFDQLNKVIEGREAKFKRLYVRASNRFGRWVDVRYYDYFLIHYLKHGVVIRFCDLDRMLDFSEGSGENDFGAYLIGKVEDYKASRDRTELIRAMKRAKRKMVIGGEYPCVNAPYGTDVVFVDRKTGEVVKHRVLGQRLKIEGCKMTLRFATDRRIDAVKLIFSGIIAGKAIRQVVRELDAGAFPPPKGGRWHAPMVSRLARNPIYFGTIVWGSPHWAHVIEDPPAPEMSGSAPVVVHGFLPDPPITRDEFFAAKRQLSGNATLYQCFRRPTQPRYLFTGKIRCARCLLLFGGLTQQPGERVYYRHALDDYGASRDCPERSLHLRASAFEQGVLDIVRGLLTDTDLEARVRAEIERHLDPTAEIKVQQEIATIRNQIAEDRAILSRLLDQLGHLTSKSARADHSSRVNAHGLAIDAAESALEAKLAERDRLVASLNVRSDLLLERGGLLQMLDAGTIQMKRAVIDRVVEVIEVIPSQHHINLVLRYA